MSPVLPSSQTTANAYQRGANSESKLERYGLTDLVIDEWKKNATGQEIADLCNKRLRQRVDDRTYYEITQRNVTKFIARFKKEAQRPFRERFAGKLEEYEDPITQAHRALKRIETEIELFQNQRTEEGLLKPEVIQVFSAMLDKLNQQFNTLANLYSKIQPQFSVTMFHNNVRNLVETVMNYEDVPDDIRGRFVHDIDRFLLSKAFIDTVASEVND